MAGMIKLDSCSVINLETSGTIINTFSEFA